MRLKWRLSQHQQTPVLAKHWRQIAVQVGCSSNTGVELPFKLAVSLRDHDTVMRSSSVLSLLKCRCPCPSVLMALFWRLLVASSVF